MFVVPLDSGHSRRRRRSTRARHDVHGGARSTGFASTCCLRIATGEGVAQSPEGRRPPARAQGIFRWVTRPGTRFPLCGGTMPPRFSNRTEAGHALAARLSRLAGEDVIVLALPRGGVPVGAEIARALHAPLDVFNVRKLGVPWHDELAMGAIAAGGVRVLNNDVIMTAGVTKSDLDQVTALQQIELDRRERLYRDGRPAPSLTGKIVILVDDGIATGASA